AFTSRETRTSTDVSGIEREGFGAVSVGNDALCSGTVGGRNGVGASALDRADVEVVSPFLGGGASPIA
ncbi:MAG: hypothetical protein AAFR34_04235, partial [Pseudomonadota bacterium]